MVYTNNVPQANQQISATQSPILGNFTFLPVSIGAEHNFNASGTGSDTYHLQASMPNRTGGDPVALPSGTNGMFYVLGGDAKFLANDLQVCQLTKGSAVANGYQWVGRVLIQWGWQPSSNSDNDSLDFNTPFPTKVFMIQAECTRTTEQPVTTNGSSVLITRLPNGSQPSLTAFNYSTRGSSVINGFWWLAIGN